MDKGKANAMLEAAQSGAVQKIRELLAAEAPLEARDVNRKTPVMLAAESGHTDAFHMLVEAGADLHAVGLGQMDLLEVASRAGNVAIVRFLLERGLPVNGHWQGPAVPALRKFGHKMPLIQAALHGHVEVVRMLLEAGADRQAKADGKTALEHVKTRLRDPVYSDSRPAYREIAGLLDGMSIPRFTALGARRTEENDASHETRQKTHESRATWQATLARPVTAIIRIHGRVHAIHPSETF